MMKKVLLLFTVLFFVVSLNLMPAQAGEGLVVLDSSAKAEFPSRLNFHLSAKNDSVISDIRLRYSIERMQFAQVVCETFIDFAPSTTVDVSWALEMVKINGLPPGTNIDYWWMVKDEAGKQNTTTPARVIFDDNRYTWQSVSADKVTIFWYRGESTFAQEMVKIAQQALTRLADYTGARLEKPVRIYVYASSSDLRGAMIFPQEWTGGVAFTRFGIVSLSIRPGDVSWAREAIPHELTHLVIHQITLNPYNDLPTWLNEGLALYVEGELARDLRGYLTVGISNNTLISVRSLCSPFSAFEDEAALSYGQSHSLVEFLLNSYGQSKMLELLETFKRGCSYDAAFVRVYGFDLDGLDSLWRKHVGVPERRVEEKVPVPAGAGK